MLFSFDQKDRTSFWRCARPEAWWASRLSGIREEAAKQGAKGIAGSRVASGRPDSSAELFVSVHLANPPRIPERELAQTGRDAGSPEKLIVYGHTARDRGLRVSNPSIGSKAPERVL